MNRFRELSDEDLLNCFEEWTKSGTCEKISEDGPLNRIKNEYESESPAFLVRIMGDILGTIANRWCAKTKLDIAFQKM